MSALEALIEEELEPVSREFDEWLAEETMRFLRELNHESCPVKLNAPWLSKASSFEHHVLIAVAGAFRAKHRDYSSEIASAIYRVARARVIERAKAEALAMGDSPKRVVKRSAP